MQIRAIVLYSKSGKRRQVDFRIGGLSIVTGGSKTGKSALIDIVDYCLGRESCTIPVGVIRDSVAWFAIHLQFPSSQLFVARRAPSPQEQSTSDVFLRLGADVKIPEFDELKANSNITSLETQLTSLLGIAANLNIYATGQPGESVFRINFRHTTFLTFQQQDEIASHKLLFHRQSDEFIPNAIRQTLPYFLGAISEDRLIKINELQRLRAEYQELQARVAEYERTVGHVERARELVSEAQQVGLLKLDEAPRDRASVDAVLAAAVSQPVAEPPSIVDDRRDQLQRERFRLMRQYRDLREEVRAAEEFERMQLGYRNELHVQQNRLTSVELFKPESENVCPLCGSVPADATPSYTEMMTSLATLRARLVPVERQVTDVREHIKRFYSQLAELKNQIDENWLALSAATAARRAIAEQEDSHRRRSYVVGRITLYLQSRQELFGGEPLEDIVARKKARLDELESELDRAEIEETQTSILNTIGGRMSEWGPQLHLEFSNSLRIELRRLSIVADTPSGPVPLDRIGGAENWVGYHLVAFTALHGHFVNSARPVPRFLMLDQPSQVYFPQDREIRAISDAPDEDEIAVARMFRFLADRVEELQSKFQIIVMDHADLHDGFFQTAVVERWRKGKALIPSDWIDERTSA